ncbi:hypothetical protein [Xanthobacter sp. KR7-225]|uniref:hypothetical protein n=1 Tax=Xanthobacter sp. KR7-225 TaxID=3156613 RepID=UPI0032B53D85
MIVQERRDKAAVRTSRIRRMVAPKRASSAKDMDQLNVRELGGAVISSINPA